MYSYVYKHKKSFLVCVFIDNSCLKDHNIAEGERLYLAFKVHGEYDGKDKPNGSLENATSKASDILTSQENARSVFQEKLLQCLTNYFSREDAIKVVVNVSKVFY